MKKIINFIFIPIKIIVGFILIAIFFLASFFLLAFLGENDQSYKF